MFGKGPHHQPAEINLFRKNPVQPIPDAFKPFGLT
jgi:hypothetical protein